ncbi:MAG: acetylglutamate kinase [Gammaproteobacteria bacterium]|nr:acetylglutamate kinase [Gammaproteobacteria bacterium]
MAIMGTGSGPTAVLKFGGDVVAERDKLAAVVSEVAALTKAGWRFLLCHGGGPQANDLLRRLGIKPVKAGGRRITDAPTLQVTKQVLAGEVSVDVVAAASGAGLRAVGISGASAGTVTARRRPPMVFSGAGPDPIDFGFVGEIIEIRTELIKHLWEGGYTPVLNTLGITSPAEAEQGICQVFNINADTVASAVAAGLKADHLFLMTNVPGVLKDKDDISTRIPALNTAQTRAAIEDGTIVGGMIPKVEEALKNLELGVGAIHILGAQEGALQGEAEHPGAQGTVLTA